MIAVPEQIRSSSYRVFGNCKAYYKIVGGMTHKLQDFNIQGLMEAQRYVWFENLQRLAHFELNIHGSVKSSSSQNGSLAARMLYRMLYSATPSIRIYMSRSKH